MRELAARADCILDGIVATPAPFRTLGRLTEARRLQAHSGGEVLLVPAWRWTRGLNRDWILEGARLNQPFLVAARGDFRGSILEWELELLRSAGYVREGRWWRPR